MKVTYTGGTTANATYLQSFDGAQILSGTGQGPFFIKWDSTGEKHVTLSINLEGQTCAATRAVVVIEHPGLFHITGGGAIVSGVSGVAIGLSGSQTGIIYKLWLNGQYTGVVIAGLGREISFGLQSLPGNYSVVAKVDGADCMLQMDGVAVGTSEMPPSMPFIGMVTFDTASNKSKVIWNKHDGLHLSHVNVFKENYQNNVFIKIGKIPFSNMSIYIDST